MGKRVLDLPSVTTLLGTDVLYAVRPTEALISNYDKKITWADLLAQISAGLGYIATDGTSTTTATIPFAQGISITGTNADASAIRIPNGSWIRPQTAGQDIYITRGTNPSNVNGVLQLNAGGIVLSHGDGTNQLDRLDLGTANTRLASFSATGVLLDFLQLGNNNISLVTDAGVGLNATSTMMSMFGSTFQLSAGAGDGAYGATGNHLWDSGIAGSTAKYQFNGSAHIASTLRIGSIPTGTQVGLVGYDANGNLIQGTGGGGGSYVTLSGHNDLTTPWSIGDASTWAGSSAGIQIDPVGSYGLHLKGNTIIEQAVSQALSLYRPVASGDVCLNFDAWDSLGAQSSYAQVCGVVVSNTAGSVGGGLDLEVAIAGVLTPLLQLRQAGSTLTGPLSVTGPLNLSGNLLQNIDRAQFNNNTSAYVTSVAQPILYSSSASGTGPFSEAGNLIISPRISGATRDVIISTLGTRADLTVDRSGNTSVAGTLTAASVTSNGLVSAPASTTTTAGLRIPHGTAPTSPVNGDLWTTTTAVLARINGTTRTFGLLGVANDWSTTQTARAWLTTVQTSTPTGTAYTWTITSGAQLELNLGSSTGNVTITTSLAVSATCVLSVVGHATLSRDVTITQSGVTFIMEGKTSGASITLDSIPATKRACYTLYFITSTKCFIDRTVLEA